jgi:hypothetical protein
MIESVLLLRKINLSVYALDKSATRAELKVLD